MKVQYERLLKMLINFKNENNGKIYWGGFALAEKGKKFWVGFGRVCKRASKRETLEKKFSECLKEN